MTLIAGLGIQFSGGEDPCDLQASVSQAMSRWQAVDSRRDQHQLKIERLDDEVALKLADANGDIVMSRKLPYEENACAPTSDRIALVVDNFFIDFTKSGAWEEGKTELPITTKALKQITSAKPSATQSPRIKISIRSDRNTSQTSRSRSKPTKTSKQLPPTKASRPDASEYQKALWLGIMGTTESQFDQLALNWGGKLKLTLALEHLKLGVALGAAAVIKHEKRRESGLLESEIFTQPVYALAGVEKCLHDATQELCALLYGGAEIFFAQHKITREKMIHNEAKIQALLQTGLDYAYALTPDLRAHLGAKLGFRPGSQSFEDKEGVELLEIHGWAWNAYAGLSYMFYAL